LRDDPPAADGAASPAPTPAQTVARPRAILAATVLGSSMAFVDGSVVHIALPEIQERLGAGASAMQWVVNAYMLAIGALMLVGGAAGDRWGRRRVFLVGTALFGAASAACGLAPDAASLVAARALQGAAGALLVPGSLAILRAAFDGEAQGRAIGTWAAFSALTTAAGPILGGWLVDLAGWRSIFLINLPLAALTLAIGVSSLPESRDPQATGRIDLAGAALAAGGLGALSWGLIAASDRGLADAGVIAALLGGAAALAAFVAWEGRTAHPMMPLGLFRDRAFAGANLYTLLLYGALSAALFLQPFLYVQVWGWSATAAGAAFLPFTLLLAALSRTAGGLAARVGARPMLVWGAVVTGAGFGWLALAGTEGAFLADVLPGMTLAGLGMAAAVAPLTTAVMTAVEDRHAGTASGINNAAARVAGLLAVAVLGSLAAAVFADRLADGLPGLALPPGAAEAVLAESRSLAGTPVPEGLGADAAAAVRALIGAAFVEGHRIALAACAGLCLGAAAVARATLPRGEAARGG
jgi:EmrB/QacA subfamily drug resistance transporter